MGGVFTISKISKNKKIKSLRVYTGKDLLNTRDILTNKGLKKRLKEHFIDEEEYIKLPKELNAEEVKELYVDRQHGETFLTPYQYGIKLFDYNKKVIISLSRYDHGNFKFNIKHLLEKEFNQHLIEQEETIDNFMDVSSGIDRFKLYEYQKKESKIVKIEFKNAEELRNQLEELSKKYSHIEPIIKDWKFYSFDNFKTEKEAFKFLHDYVKENSYLTENDEIAWEEFLLKKLKN